MPLPNLTRSTKSIRYAEPGRTALFRKTAGSERTIEAHSSHAGSRPRLPRLGVIFPQTESGVDPIALRDYIQAVEAIGFHHLTIYDHVLGADPATRPGWRSNYSHRHSFHEPFAFLSFAA